MSDSLLHEIVAYDPDSGGFTWKITVGARGKKGNPAGCV